MELASSLCPPIGTLQTLRVAFGRGDLPELCSTASKGALTSVAAICGGHSDLSSPASKNTSFLPVILISNGLIRLRETFSKLGFTFDEDSLPFIEAHVDVRQLCSTIPELLRRFQLIDANDFFHDGTSLRYLGDRNASNTAARVLQVAMAAAVQGSVADSSSSGLPRRLVVAIDAIGTIENENVSVGMAFLDTQTIRGTSPGKNACDWNDRIVCHDLQVAPFGPKATRDRPMFAFETILPFRFAAPELDAMMRFPSRFAPRLPRKPLPNPKIFFNSTDTRERTPEEARYGKELEALAQQSTSSGVGFDECMQPVQEAVDLDKGIQAFDQQHKASDGTAVTAWADLISDPHVIQNIESVCTRPLPLHRVAIPYINDGSSVSIQSPPSTGKVLGYLVSLLDQIMARKNLEGTASSPSTTSPSVIIISPFCLLAGYIVQMASRLIGEGENPLPIKVGGAYCDIRYEDQYVFIEGADIVVMTPRHGLDLVKKNSISVEQVQTLVIEEAETILEEQFHDFTELLGMVKYRQVITVTVNIDKDARNTIEGYLKPSLSMKWVYPRNSVDIICEQSFIHAPPRKDLRARISAFLDELNRWQTNGKLVMGQSLLVFTANHLRARAVKEALVDFTGLKDERIGLIHHELSVLQRESVLRAFIAKKILILVSAHQCRLGFTFQHMPFVVVFDVPVAKGGRRVYDKWATLVTRTGRLGQFGHAATLIDPVRDRDLMMNIRERFEKFDRPVPDWFATRSKE